MKFMDRIRRFISRDKTVQSTSHGRGYPYDDPTSGAIDNVTVTGSGVRSLSAALSMDQHLMQRYADYENMDDYPELCLSGESMIFTLRKGWVSIRDLAKMGEPFHVISYDKDLRSLVPAEAHSARLTGKEGHGKRIVQVILDNGQTIKCTEDHLFMAKNEEWVAAKNLKPGQRLMPGCLRMRSLNIEADLSYWEVHQPNSDSVIRSSDGKRWTWVHRLVGDKFLGLKEHDIVHHIDSDSLNNDPENLSVVRVECLESSEDVFDLTVPGYHNFVCNGVVVHNSAALDIYADDATIPHSVRGKTIWAESKDRVVRDVVDDLLHRRLRIEEDIWLAVRTLCKYGNCTAEIVTSDVGVVGLNFLPVPTIRRLTTPKGELVGYVQDLTGSFNIDLKDYKKISDLKNKFKEKGMVFFEPWEIVHWRLQSKFVRSLYGYSILDAARWIWKRLAMLEDTALVYKLCLRGDSQIWTPSGRVAIRDLEEGDEVYSYTTADKLKKSKVIYKKHNGADQLFRVKSVHRELYANETHPVLVETIIGRGSGCFRGRRMDYVEVKDLIPGEHRLVTPFKDDELCDEIKLVIPETGQKARLSERAIRDGVKIEVGIRRLQDNCGMQSNLIKLFFKGEYEVVAHTARRLLEENGTDLGYLEIRDDWGGVKDLSLPSFVTPDFARWFGFMIGDGFVSERPFARNGRSYLVRDVGFASGDKEDINEKYRNLFGSFFGCPKFYRDKRSKHECVGKFSISSKALYEFMILNGFVPGAHNKRVPEWVFRASYVVRKAFLEGLADADGHIVEGGVSEDRGRVRHRRVELELCNLPLVEDVRELVMQSGHKVSAITPRTRKGGREILNNGYPLPERVSYAIGWSDDRQPMTEVLKSVEKVEVDDIWDIGVEADEHNFVANGIVVHNTRSPGRYAFYVDTGDMPPQEAMAYVNKVRRKYKKRTLINPTTGQMEFRNNPLCLTGDTKVPLLDGRVLSIEEIVEEREAGVEHWVYSCRPNDGKLLPMPLTWAGKTRRDAEIVKITLDNGEEIRCTPDHKFPLRDGTKVSAAEIAVGSSMMPFRRYKDRIVRVDNLDGKLNGYEKVYDPSDKKWKWTHRVVGEEVLGAYSDSVVHHLDFNRCNNDPSNLSVMKPSDHRRLHRESGRTGAAALARLRKHDSDLDAKLKNAASRTMVAFNKTEAQRRNTSNRNKRLNTKRYLISYNGSEKHIADNDIRRAAMAEMWDRNRASIVDKCRLDFDEVVWNWMRCVCEEDPSVTFAEVLDRLNLEMRDHLLSINNGYRYSDRERIASSRVLKMRLKENGFKGLGGFKNSVFSNHKVVSVEYLKEHEDTFTLTVNGTHTFALDAGIFTFNSPEDDMWIPTRGGKESTRVEVMAGPDWQCLTGDTPIPLLDGTTLTIAELSDRNSDVWLYAMNEKGEVVPGKGHSARKTKKAEVWEIELDNGQIVRCSDNHPFMLRDGTWLRADQLVQGCSLMPLYSEVSSFESGDRLDGYEKVFDPAEGKFIYTHQMVHRWRTGSLLPRNGHVIHHAGTDKLDNRPDFLKEMSRSEHSKLHLSLVDHLHSDRVKKAAAEAKKTSEFRRKMRLSWTTERRNELSARNANASEEMRAAASARISKWNGSKEHREFLLANHPRKRDVELEELASVANENGVQSLKEMYALGYSQNLIYWILGEAGIGWCDFAKQNIEGWVPKGRAVAALNHKVVSVKRTGEEEWLYDLTVDDYHNFAIGQGIFVHNSMDDIEYFRDKMFTAIKIPRAYYGGDAEAEQGLAQKDVRFARTCMRVQREFRNGIRQIVRVHMASMNIDPDSIEWDTRMTVPSSIFELQQIEVMNAQAGLIDTLADHFPEEWLLERVFHVSKEEASSMMEWKANEDERKAVDAARVESDIAKKYPEAEVDKDNGGSQNENVDVAEEFAKLNKRIEETMKTSSRVLQRVKEIEPKVDRHVRKLNGSMSTALRQVQ